MSEAKRICFVIMPFDSELHYFFLYLKQHLEQIHNIKCERADNHVLTMPILEKINNYIRNSDVIIADCSGRNPNVFYELGLAHTYGKKVILITKDPVHEAPSDIRHYEFIKYELDKDAEFFKNLDNALRNVFFERYKNMFEKAKGIFTDFKRESHAQVSMVNEDTFSMRVIAAERTQELPSIEDDKAIIDFVLPKIIADSTDVAVMSQIIDWLEKK